MSFTLGMIIGIAYATLFICTLEAMQRKYQWIESLIGWIEKHLPDKSEGEHLAGNTVTEMLGEPADFGDTDSDRATDPAERGHQGSPNPVTDQMVDRALAEFKKFWDRPFASPEGDRAAARAALEAALLEEYRDA